MYMHTYMYSLATVNSNQLLEAKPVKESNRQASHEAGPRVDKSTLRRDTTAQIHINNVLN